MVALICSLELDHCLNEVEELYVKVTHCLNGSYMTVECFYQGLVDSVVDVIAQQSNTDLITQVA